jgi:Zn-dependent M28 family amino/carboxypeptidase
LLALVASVAGATPPPSFPAERAWAHLEAVCAGGPRVPGTPGHQAGLDYIHVTLERAGARVTLQAFRDSVPGLGRTVELTNVIARLGPERAGGLLLGTHWDSRPWADRDPDALRRDAPILGANDGGSGTAVLLTLAEMWRAAPPPIPITLVFFDGEDVGRKDEPEEYLTGSRHFAAHLTDPRPELALVLDMVGSATMSLSIEERAREYFPDWASLIDGLALDLGLDAYRSDWGPAVYDDHLPLIEAGLPALLLIDFRDPYWHTHGDIPAHCSAASLGEAGQLVTALVHGGAIR